jgi:DNA repair exonuclease SbcCD ATPase subunit
LWSRSAFYSYLLHASALCVGYYCSAVGYTRTMADVETTVAPVAPEAAADKTTAAKISLQLKKLNEANNKYKNLLKMAKERIQKQEEELETLRREKEDLEGRLPTEEDETANQIVLEDNSVGGGDETTIVRVWQRIKTPVAEGLEEIWALMEMEVISDSLSDTPSKRFKEWKKFKSEAELQDYIRRDTGEPLQMPAFSLTPDESDKIQKEAMAQVASISEEYRRFRVKSELSRKQAEAQIRDLQNNNVQSAARRIEKQDLQQEIEQARSAGNQVEQLRRELAAQEAHWKEAYDTLLAENDSLKSSGSEALLASQWRQRYEACLQEKEELKARLESNGTGDSGDEAKYEMKYRDLKESFRLYRKKAKEIFEAGNMGNLGSVENAMNVTGKSSSDAKLNYLKNLMVNYFTAEDNMKDQMETAIGTVLQFSPDELSKIQKKKAASESWF